MKRHSELLPFGEALFKIGEKQNLLTTLEEDFLGVLQLLDEVSHFKNILYTPAITKDQKLELVRKTLKESVHPMFYRFFEILIQRNAQFHLYEIYTFFQELLDKKLGRLRVKVTTAVKIEQDTEQKLINTLEKRFNKKVYITKQLKPDILGGLIVQTPDFLMNLSLRKGLSDMKISILDSKIERMAIYET